VTEVAQGGLLHRGGDGDFPAVARHVHLCADGDDGGGVADLLEVQEPWPGQSRGAPVAPGEALGELMEQAVPGLAPKYRQRDEHDQGQRCQNNGGEPTGEDQPPSAHRRPAWRIS
jgi:hypothetical protein